MDLFAGAGANAISFALQPDGENGSRRRWDRVVAVERDAATLACAQHNATLHGLGAGSILWVLGDSFEFLKEAVVPARSSSGEESIQQVDGEGAVENNSGEEDEDDLKIDPATTVLFASPPWGGPGYSTDAVFDSNTMEPYNLAKLHGAYRQMDHALYLPRTSDLRQIARLAPPAVDGEDVAAAAAVANDDGEAGKEESGSGGGDNGSHSNGTKNKRKKIEVVQYCVEGASKALVAYIPAAPAPAAPQQGTGGDIDEDGDTNIEGNGT